MTKPTRPKKPTARVQQKMDEYGDACRRFERIRVAMEEIDLRPAAIPAQIGNEWSVTYWSAWVAMWHLWWWLTHHGLTKDQVNVLRHQAIAGMGI